jgi:FkbM family methyltransferase
MMQDEYVVAVITKTPQGFFAIGAQDRFVGLCLRQYGSYGAAEIQAATAFLGKDEQVLVVGAHVGTIAIPLAQVASHVTMVEANPWTFKLLEANLALNDVMNATAIHVAASDRNEIIRFVANNENSGGSKRWPLVQDNEFFYDDPAIVEVQAQDLDTVLEGRGPFHVIVMDIEGSEPLALRGMNRICSQARALLVEWMPRHLRLVAGVTPEQWLEPIAKHFSRMYVPTQTTTYIGRQQILEALNGMYEENHDDPALVFAKEEWKA